MRHLDLANNMPRRGIPPPNVVYLKNILSPPLDSLDHSCPAAAGHFPRPHLHGPLPQSRNGSR